MEETTDISDSHKDKTMAQEIAFLVNLNADLQTRLEHKDAEIQRLFQRLALYEGVAASLAPPLLPAPVQDPVKGYIPQEEERYLESQQQLQQEECSSGPNDAIAKAPVGHPSSKQEKEPEQRDLTQTQQRVNNGASGPHDALPNVPLAPFVPSHSLASSSAAIGDYHSINSISLPLLSAAHMSRSHTTVTTNSLMLNHAPSTVDASDAVAGAAVATAASSSSSSAPHHNTDTASIRRMYMSLEKGPGTKPDLFFQNPDIFFQTTVGVLEFEEDSPSFRRKLVALDENVEGVRNYLHRLVNIIQKYIEAGMTFSAVGRTFASELMHLKGGKPGEGGGGGGGGGGVGGSSAGVGGQGQSWFTRLGDLAPALVRFGETFDEIQSYNDAVLFSLESTFLTPMREFVKRELKEVKTQKEEVNRAHEDYLLHLQRHLQQLKRGTDPAVIRARTQELIAVRRRYELGRFDLMNTLNQLETKKKFQLMERILCALYAYLGYFHQGHKELAIIEPSMRELQHRLRLSRREFSTQARILEAKRMQLELLLTTSIANISNIKAQMALDDWGPCLSQPPAQSPALPSPLSEGEARQEGNAVAESVTAGVKASADTASQQQLHHDSDNKPPCPIELSYTSSSSSSTSSSPPASPVPPVHRSSVSSSSSSKITSPHDATGTLDLLSLRSPESEPVVQPLETNGLQENATSCEKSPSQAVSVAMLPSHSNAPDDNLFSSSPSSSPSRLRTNRMSVDGQGFPFYLKQGYLWKRSSNVRKDWKRRFFSIRKGKLSYQREDDPIGPPRAVICDLLISTVRECVRDTDTRFTFEILSPEKRPYMLQAENEMEFQEWIKALRSSTETLLMTGEGGDRPFSYASSSDPTDNTTNTARGNPFESSNSLCPSIGRTCSAVAAAAIAQVMSDFVKRIQNTNPVCADCQSAGPEWACVNFGTVICIECSGVHRSLGVHVSKVRSLLLDAWPRSLRAVMDAMGNNCSNKVWEAQVQANRRKPEAAAGREEREVWIRDKYVGRLFVDQEKEGKEDPDAILYTAARKADLGRMSWALAHGAIVNNVNEKERNRTPIHAVCQAGKSLAALEFLVLNGGSVDVVDLDEVSPLDLAMGGGNVIPSLGIEQSSKEWQQLRQEQARQQNQPSINNAAMPLVSYLLFKLDKRIS